MGIHYRLEDKFENPVGNLTLVWRRTSPWEGPSQTGAAEYLAMHLVALKTVPTIVLIFVIVLLV